MECEACGRAQKDETDEMVTTATVVTPTGTEEVELCLHCVIEALMEPSEEHTPSGMLN